MRLASALIFVSAICGCTSGDSPGTADASTANGRSCSATLTTMGSFAPDPAATPPVDSTGCWPAGVWTFTAAVTQNDCTKTPVPEAQYQFKGTQTNDMNGDPIVNTFTYLNDPTNTRVTVKVSEGGSGLCEGELTIYSTDGKIVWLLKPELNADNTITGDGEYGEFTTDQWPF